MPRAAVENILQVFDGRLLEPRKLDQATRLQAGKRHMDPLAFQLNIERSQIARRGNNAENTQRWFHLKRILRLAKLDVTDDRDT